MSDNNNNNNISAHIASDLALFKIGGLMIPDGHEKIVTKLQENLPAVLESSKNFGKRQSEFMNSMLTVHQPTPIRRARQCCAEIESSWSALREHFFKRKKQELKSKGLELDISNLKRLELQQAAEVKVNGKSNNTLLKIQLKIAKKKLKIDKLNSDNIHAEKFISGAMRRVAQLSQQYTDILKSAGKEHFTEADFEEEEVEYHIKTAYLQALTAARAHGGRIDEGNHIYLQQIGVNGMVAQKAVTELLDIEETKVHNTDTHLGMEWVWKWLDERFEIHKDDVQTFTNMKGQSRTYFKELTIGIDAPGLKDGEDFYLDSPEKHS